ncbi:AAA family ATPase [Labilibaculum sp. A4]|uniref:AAA family ATPase n=1 Tax=Labilibaculum euxinus TaxID=2686357 RepID=UPI0013658518|nr:AAA family ATPase [Labilibaculum euxinus]MDQ1769367.1 AAA family ATPase [Labilibaculum euxinus]MWN74893.1 AAA family ATPase [Labilibaculum euxinus]
MVKLICRTKLIANGIGVSYSFRHFIHSIGMLDSSRKKEVIQKEIYKLFNLDYCSTFRISAKQNNTLVNLPPNKIFNQSQRISKQSNVITLIGENGSGKSAILESIFNSSLYAEEKRFICFSSGQNEIYSKIYNKILLINKVSLLSKNRVNSINFEDEKFDVPVKAFYFDKSWIRLLIFFAKTFYPKGKVSKFIDSKTSNGNDNKIILELPFRIDWNFVTKVRLEREREEHGQFSEFLQTKFFKKLTWLLENIFDNEYDYQAPIRKTTSSLSIEKALKVFQEKSSDLVFNFFWLASSGAKPYFDLSNTQLKFNDIELDDLSDGEFQLLAIYALIDHFDNANTVFLFDEIDSHLYFQNIERLWHSLSSLKANVITTTHISDSILHNNFCDIKLVKEGKVEQELTLRELAKRLSSVVGNNKFEYQLVRRIKNIVLLDHEDDWVIFKKLVQKKTEEDVEKIFSQIVPFQRSSSYNNDSEIFGKGKLMFVEDFKEHLNETEVETQNFFLICDRDKLSKGSISKDLQVKINNLKRLKTLMVSKHIYFAGKD